MTYPQAVATRMIDDARVLVTRFDFAPQAQTSWHRHDYDYVITAVTDCFMLIEEPRGTWRETMVKAGTSYCRDKGVAHNVINNGAAPMTFVEVELK